MPSPFPGMDPYLEGSLWATLHSGLGVQIAYQLAPRLRPRYIALPVEYMMVEEGGDVAVTAISIAPDVSVVETGMGVRGRSTVGVMEAPYQLATVMPAAVPHVSVEIRDTAERILVTSIEILSPTNKRSPARHEYLSKRRRVLLSAAHLLEIDLLRTGSRVPVMGELPAAPYYVFLSREERRPLMDVWPIVLDQSLPTVPVPLLSGDPDVPLDLQAALTAVYDGLNLDLAINYRQDPEIPLPEDLQEWANVRLRGAELRTPSTLAGRLDLNNDSFHWHGLSSLLPAG